MKWIQKGFVLVLSLGLLVFLSRGLMAKVIPGPALGQMPVTRVPGIGESVLAIHFSQPSSHPLYVGTRRGLYRSEDQGLTWKRVLTRGMGGGSVTDIAFHPNDPNVIMAAAGESLFGSSDGGRHWRRLLHLQNPILCVAVDPRSPAHLLIGTGQGIRISQDQGVTWIPRDPGVSTGAVTSLVFHPSVAGWCYALTEAGLFRSQNSGVTWERVRVALRPEAQDPAIEEPEETQVFPSTGLAIDPLKGILYLGMTRGVLTSQDNGTTWVALASVGFTTSEIFQLLVVPDALYAATAKGLFLYSGDFGVWRPIREGLPAGAVYAVALGPEGKQLWVGMGSGLFRIPAPSEAAGTLLQLHPSDREPSVRQMQEAAIQYAEVMPGKIQGWRRGAVWRNWFPKFTLSLDRNRNDTVVSSTSGGRTTFSVGPEDQSFKVGFGFTWDLANFIWNPDQTSIDTRSRLMVQLRQDVLDEANRLYFERRRLLAEFQGSPTEDPLLKTERALRLEELTAGLDALTGGWFSENLSSSDSRPPATKMMKQTMDYP